MKHFLETIEENSNLYPNRTAILEDDTGITYGEFWLRSSRVYVSLHRRQIGPGDVVMIHLSNTIDTIISCIGIMRAGAAFLIAGSEHDGDAIRYMYEDGGCRYLIDESAFFHMQSEKGIDGMEDVSEHTPAYIIYTSGTTRKPKGVMLERGAMTLCMTSFGYQGDRLIRGDDRIALLSPLTFTAGLIVMNITLSGSATLCVASRGTLTTPAAMRAFFEKNKITACFMTPALYRVYHDFNPQMRAVILGGEAVPDDLLIQTGEAGEKGMDLYNMYGQSESGFVVTMQRLGGAQHPASAGLPQSDSIRVLILDEDGHPVKDGETGELCYENPFFRGYVGMEDETRRVLRNGLIHSGDLCRHLPDGTIRITGRMDDMVKIHGLQVRPSEIEDAISQCFDVSGVVVRCTEQATKVFICAYYTGETELSPVLAREKLASHLPGHMLPTHFFHVSRISFNQNGKADYESLPSPAGDSQPFISTAKSLPKAELSEIVQTVAQFPEPIDKDTSLISLGMSSLTFIELIGEIEKRTHVRLCLSDIMKQPDIAHISALIREASENNNCHLQEPRKASKDRAWLPLTPNQLGIFTECEAHKDSIQYNIPSYVPLSHSDADVDSVRKAIRTIATIHPALSTRIFYRKDIPADAYIDGCEVYQHLTFEDPVIEYTILERDFDNDVQEKAFFQSKVTPFDLFRDRLYRIGIFETPGKLYLFFDVHHIIADGYSLRILADDITTLLSGESIPSEKLSFPDYISQKTNAGILQTDSQEYQHALMAGVESFRYPYRLAREGDALHQTAVIQQYIPKASIHAYCMERSLTPSSYFHASFLLTLHLLTGAQPFIATTYSGRAELAEALMRTAGLFAKSVPVVWSMGEDPEDPGNMRPEDYIRSIQAQILETCSHDEVLYSKLPARTDILLTFQGELGTSFVGRGRGIRLELDTPLFPIHLVAGLVGSQYEISLYYDQSLFHGKDMSLLYSSFVNVLDRMDKAGTLRELALTPPDVSAILRKRSGQRVLFDDDATWIRDFQLHAKNRPSQTAVMAENGTYTYEELDTLSDRIASRLFEQGVGAGDFVAVRMPRVREFPAAILGIQKCGGAYIPVDVDYPPQRIEYILKDSGAAITVDEAFVSDAAGARPGTFPVQARSSGPAYMIYTSGSTGDPKGVVISHHALYNYLAYVRNEMKLDPNSRISCYASFSFDISIEGLLAPLVSGGTSCIIPSAVRKDISALETYLREQAVTGGCFPTQIGQLLGQRDALDMEYLTLIGEKMTAIPGNKGHVYNAYGPTECTVVCTYYDVQKGHSYTDIPIGKPMYNTGVLILDPFGNLLPDGAIGELCVCGPQLAAGYHNLPGKTAQVFAPLSQSPSVRVYHTGDLAKVLPDGNLMFLGRSDRQLKRRGYRIEPGEIESAARRLPWIREAVILADHDRLILYYTAASEEDATDAAANEELRIALEAELPPYMLPDGFMKLKAMPLTPAGKVDVRKLPAFQFQAGVYTPPRDEIERFVCSKMADVLHLEKVGIHDDFFELGGSSLDVVQLKLKLGEDFEISDIYNGRTVSGILKEAHAKRRVYDYDRLSIYPLTEEQKKFFFVPDVGARPELSYANVPLLFRLPEDTDLEKLQKMLTKVIDNHPYLKVRYIENPDPRANAEDWFVARRDDSIQAEVSLVRTHKLDQDSLIRPYDLLGNENLYRAVLYEVDEGAPYLFWDFHHIIYDQESLLVLAEDVKRLMEGRPLIPEDVSGYETALEERWRKDGEKEEIAAYFRELLKDCDKDINSWIYDRTDPYTLFKSGRTFDEQKGFACMIGSRIISVRESSVPMQQIRSRCADLNITENMFFTAIFACLLGELNGRSKALFATVVNNRDYGRLKHTVTMLCRTVPVYLKVTQDELTSPHFLKQLRHVMSNAGRASILSYEDICRMNGISLPRITVIYYDKPVDRELIPGCRRVSLNTLDTIDTLMLKVYYDSRDTLFFRLDTSLDFTKQEVDFMAGRLEELIRRI